LAVNEIVDNGIETCVRKGIDPIDIKLWVVGDEEQPDGADGDTAILVRDSGRGMNKDGIRTLLRMDDRGNQLAPADDVNEPPFVSGLLGFFGVGAIKGTLGFGSQVYVMSSREGDSFVHEGVLSLDTIEAGVGAGDVGQNVYVYSRRRGEIIPDRTDTAAFGGVPPAVLASYKHIYDRSNVYAACAELVSNDVAHTLA
jgi:Histidine kinase-, DNA gyrase B-, and HSP90-like ATPase